MPRISQFFGISIYMHFDEHLPPHFHALYADDEAQIEIESLNVMRGRLHPRPVACARMGTNAQKGASRELAPRNKSATAAANSPSLDKLVRVKKARHVRDYVIEFTFTDGSVREIDLDRYLWGPVFEPVRNPDYFRRFKVDRVSRTITWPNGADIDPDVLYLGLTPAGWQAADR